MSRKRSNRNIFAPLGASNHVDEEREKNDYYATEPKAMEILLEHEVFNKSVWECACGEGHLAKVLERSGYDVLATDLIYRGYGEKEPLDFLSIHRDERFGKDGFWSGDIITNPPYNHALEFIQKSLELINEGGKVAMFLKLLFLEGQKRKPFFLETPPKTVYVSSSRLLCAKNGAFSDYSSSATAYGWYIWEKGYKREPIIKWIN